MAKLATVTIPAADTVENQPHEVTGVAYRGAIILHDNPTWLGRGTAHAILAPDGSALAVADTLREAHEWVRSRLAAGLPLARVSRLNN